LVFEYKDLSATEIHLLVRVDGNKVRSHLRVAKWCVNLKTRRISAEDCERSGSPTTASTVTPILLQGRQGNLIVTGPLYDSLYHRTAETGLPI